MTAFKAIKQVFDFGGEDFNIEGSTMKTIISLPKKFNDGTEEFEVSAKEGGNVWIRSNDPFIYRSMTIEKVTKNFISVEGFDLFGKKHTNRIPTHYFSVVEEPTMVDDKY